MTKRLHKSAIVTLITLLLCALSMVCAFGFTNVNTSNAEDVTPLTENELSLVKAAGWFDENGTPDNDAELDLGSGSFDDAMELCTYDVEIGSAKQLARLAYLVAKNGKVKKAGSETEYLVAYNVTLTADIDLENKLWIPVGNTSRADANAQWNENIFRGTINGNHKTVKNLSSDPFYNHVAYNTDSSTFYVDCGDSQKIELVTKSGETVYGLFGVTAATEVKDITVTGVSIDMPSKSVNGKTFKTDGVGSLIGLAIGDLKMTNCVAGRKATADNSDNGGYIRGAGTSGGIIGRSNHLKVALKNSAGEKVVKDGKQVYVGDVVAVNENVSNPQIRKVVSNYYDDFILGSYEMYDCHNYLGVGTMPAGENNAIAGSEKNGGINGYVFAMSKIVIKDCTNNGDIYGRQAGGIVGYWQIQPTLGTEEHTLDYYFEIIGCKNYGQITAVYQGGGITSGVNTAIGSRKSINYTSLKTVLKDCVNYGTVISGKNQSGANGGALLGGIVGTTEVMNSELAIDNCFNFGRIDCGDNSAASSHVGGILGQLQFITPTANLSASELPSVKLVGANAGEVKMISGSNQIGSTLGHVMNKPAQLVWDNRLVTARRLEGEAIQATVIGENKDIIDAVVSNGTVVPFDDDAFLEDVFYTVRIPASVTAIAPSAFLGRKNIEAVVFMGDNVTVIGEWAFAGTSVQNAVLPDGVTTIGLGAFADCANLQNVSLPDSVAEIDDFAFANCSGVSLQFPSGADSALTFGESVIDNATVVLKDKSQYLALKDTQSFADMSLTYPVAVVYKDGDVTVDTEMRLFGKGYAYDCDNIYGAWRENQHAALGTVRTGSRFWYSSKTEQSDPLTPGQVSDLINASTMPEEVVLYTGVGKVFIGRNNIVFNENTTYALNDINKLLAPGSSTIANNTATIEAFAPFVGDAPEKTPTTIKSAGVYTIKVTEDDNEYVFTITVQRKTIDIATYEYARWCVIHYINGGYATADSVLDREPMGSTDTPLYVYTKSDGSAYYSYTVLSAEKRISLSIPTAEYSTIVVRRSIVNNLIKPDAEKEFMELTMFGVANGFNSEAGKVTLPYTFPNWNDRNPRMTTSGRYSKLFTLQAKADYVLTLTNDENTQKSGITEIEILNDGQLLKFRKALYVIDFENWFISGNADEVYHIGDRTFGESTVLEAPKLMYGNSNDIRFDLYFGGYKNGKESINGENRFTRYELSDYVNSAMPAGSYRLEAYAPEATDNDGNTLSAFMHSFDFTVREANINIVQTEKINAVLKGKTFSYLWDDKAHLYDDEAALTVNEALNTLRNSVYRSGIWTDGKFDDCYGDFVMAFSLDSLSDSDYAPDLDRTSGAHKYTVYYAIKATNFKLSISELNTDERAAYYFEVVNVMKVAVPTVLPKIYNGTLQTADVSAFDSDLYSIVNNGGTNVEGEYKVILTLLDPECYMWADETIDSRDPLGVKELLFAIEKNKDNKFDEEAGVGIVLWNEGKYNPEINIFFGSPTFGSARFVVTDISGKTVYYDEEAGINKLAGLKSGNYTLRVIVEDTANYNGLEKVINFEVLPKIGLPWWATLLITVGALMLAALIIFILWKKGVFQILTEKIVVAIRTRASVEATIASVRAAKRMEEGRQSVAEAKRRERIEEMRKKAQEQRALPAEERAAQLEAKAQADAEKAAQLLARSEASRAKAAKMRGNAVEQQPDEEQQPVDVEQEIAADDATENPTEE